MTKCGFPTKTMSGSWKHHVPFFSWGFLCPWSRAGSERRWRLDLDYPGVDLLRRLSERGQTQPQLCSFLWNKTCGGTECVKKDELKLDYTSVGSSRTSAVCVWAERAREQCTVFGGETYSCRGEEERSSGGPQLFTGLGECCDSTCTSLLLQQLLYLFTLHIWVFETNLRKNGAKCTFLFELRHVNHSEHTVYLTERLLKLCVLSVHSSHRSWKICENGVKVPRSQFPCKTKWLKVRALIRSHFAWVCDYENGQMAGTHLCFSNTFSKCVRYAVLA